MEVGTSSEKPDELQSKDLLAGRSFILDSLSIQLQLDELWRTLSKCLDMLAQTSDPHAVLILQPSVEAFFLVHATNTEENKVPKKSRGSSSSRGRLGQLSSFRVTSETGSNPTSPAPRMDVSPIPSTPGLTKGEESYSHLPPDTARFLMFAGMPFHVIYSELDLTCQVEMLCLELCYFVCVIRPSQLSCLGGSVGRASAFWQNVAGSSPT